MAQAHMKRLTVQQVLFVQVAASFVVIGVLIALGGVLVFRVMGSEYTQFTTAGFIATVYLSFITFQPAATLYAARSELIQGRVDTGTAKAGPDEKPQNPWAATLRVSVPVAVLCTVIVADLIYGFGWRPSAREAVLAALLYVVPHYLITARYIRRDLTVFASRGLGSGKRAASLPMHFLSMYALPSLVFQGIINGALAGRGFVQEARKLAVELPGLVGYMPAGALAADLAITFVFVCGFTALAATTYMLSDVFQGIVPLRGKGLRMNGFLLFLLILVMGVCSGGVFGAVLYGLGYIHAPLVTAFASKFVCVFLAVAAGVFLGSEWVKAKIIQRMQGG